MLHPFMWIRLKFFLTVCFVIIVVTGTKANGGFFHPVLFCVKSFNLNSSIGMSQIWRFKTVPCTAMIMSCSGNHDKYSTRRNILIINMFFFFFPPPLLFFWFFYHMFFFFPFGLILSVGKWFDKEYKREKIEMVKRNRGSEIHLL